MKKYFILICTFLVLGLTSCGSKSSVISTIGSDNSTSPDNAKEPNNGGGDSGGSIVPANCPTNFVKIPANNTLGTSEFCISKFEMKASLNDGTPVFDTNNGGNPLDVSLHKPESRSDGLPWTRITLPQAAAECAGLGSGYHLSTLKEWQAVALNVESVSSNWSGNVAGSGTLVKGHSDSAVSVTAVTDGYAVSAINLLSAGNGTDPYGGTGQSSGNQKRTYTLSNGEIIWDLSGNAREIVDPNGNGNGTGVNYTGPGSSGFYEVLGSEVSSMLSSLTFVTGTGGLTLSLFTPATPSLTNAANEIGRIYISSNARTDRMITRGGNFSSTNSPGLFAADFDAATSGTSSSASFRCVKTL